MIDAVPSAGLNLDVLGWPSGMRPMQIRIDGVVVADLVVTSQVQLVASTCDL